MPRGLPPTPEGLLDALRGVIDPELGADIVDLGMAQSVAIDQVGAVTVSVILTTAGCPLKAQIRKDVRARLGAMAGVTAVDVTWGVMTAEQKTFAMSRARLAKKEAAPTTAVPAAARVIAVSSGKGGVGKSSVTVNLAVALAAEGLAIGVLDADIGGFSVPRLLGVAGRLEGAGGGKIAPAVRSVGLGRVEVVSMGLLAEDEEAALMWRGLVQNRALQHFLEDVDWGDIDLLLVDMPPGTGDVQMGLVRMLPRAEVVIVTTPALAAQKVAARAADLARKSYVRVAGVVENMSSFTCDHGTSYALFGSGGGQTLADELGVPLLASIPLEPAVSAGGDVGQPVALGHGPAAEAFRALARRVLDDTPAPAEMAGCSARILDAMEAALGPKT